MVDVWNELGKAVGRALKPLAEIPAAMWKSLQEAASDLAEGFMGAAEGVSEAMEPLIAPHMETLMEEATSALLPGSPKKEVKEKADKLTKALMKALEKNIPEKGESPPKLEDLLVATSAIIATNIGLDIGLYGVTMGLDLVHPIKEMGFRHAGMKLLDSFQLPSMIGPSLQAPVWSGVIAPLRMRWNEKFPYLVPGTGVLPYLAAKGLIDDEGYKLNMKFNAFDETWSDAMLENTWRYPSFSELRTMIHRGDMTWAHAELALEKSLVHVGFLAAYEGLVPSIPAVSDLVRFAVREAYPDATTFTEHFAKMKDWIGKVGYSPYFADAFWTAHWIIPTIGQADTMLHRGNITEEEHTALYILNDIRPEDIPRLRALTWKLPGRIESRWMFRWGEVDVTDLRDALVKDGLDPAYADQVARAVAKNQYLSDINRQVANSKIAFVKGYSLEATLRADLTVLGLRSEMVEYHVSDSLADRERAMHDEELRTLRSQYARGAMTMADVVEASTPIIVDVEVRESWLAALPTAKQVVIMEETFGTEINRLVANAKYDYVRGYITKPDMVRRFTLLDLPTEVIEFHVLDADEDRDRKRNDERLIVIKDMWMKDVETDFDVIEGWVDPIIVEELARNLWLSDTYFDKLKAPLRPPKPPALPTVTLATMTRAFREGIITESDLRGELRRRGYSPRDIELMVAVEKARIPVEE